MSIHRGAVLLVCAIAISLGSGCNFLRNFCPTMCPVVTFNGGIQVGFSCKPAGQRCTGGATESVAEGKIIEVPADYRSATTLLATITQTVDSGTEVAGVGSECGPVCVPAPESPACDDCRSTVAAGIITPFMSLCVGSAYQLPPPTAWLIAEVATDTGTYRSQPIQVFQRPGTVRYDNCGSPTTADYDFDQSAAQTFSQYVVQDRHARELRYFHAEQVYPGGADGNVPLVSLTPEANALIQQGKADELDAAATEFGISTWVFAAGGGDPLLGYGAPDGAIMTERFSGARALDLVNGAAAITGEAQAQLKPCRSDADCSFWGLVCLPSDVGLVCKAP
jgi:hypothetical protein